VKADQFERLRSFIQSRERVDTATMLEELEILRELDEASANVRERIVQANRAIDELDKVIEAL
jgi:hypothetical protein